MLNRTLPLPAPFHALKLFSLTEPVGETDTTIEMAERLYMAAPSAPGGKILLQEGPRRAVSKPASYVRGPTGSRSDRGV